MHAHDTTRCACHRRTYRPCDFCSRLFLIRTSHEKDRGSPQRYCSRICWKADWPKRFWAKVDQSGDCWLWTGGTSAKGYGVFALDHGGPHAHQTSAHRIAFGLAKGEVPDDLLVCHSCDTPRCCNPEHLFLGTCQENIDDMMRKRRHWSHK
jgi:hypothetical protein